MANFTLRLLTVFLFSALVLNASNFLFVRVYNAARQSPYRIMRGTIDPKYWSAAIACDDKNSSFANGSRRNNYSELELTTYSAYYLMSKNPESTAAKEMENCPELPPDLGPEQVDRSVIAANLRYSKAKLDDVKPGGIYKPPNCKSLQSVAIIIAYSNFSQEQRITKYITTQFNRKFWGGENILIAASEFYLVNVHVRTGTRNSSSMTSSMIAESFMTDDEHQLPDRSKVPNKSQPYNRGKLLNVGFTIASRSRKDGFRCIILHEPNIVPLDTRNLYRCGWYPRQLATAVERPVKSPYQPLIGGAIALTPEQFLKFNGFSNAYWGNDANYYDLYNRINASNYYVESSFPLVGKYKTIRKGLALWNKSEYLSTPSPMYLLDGLTSLSYSVDSFELRRLFTYLKVNIDAMVETETRAKMYNKLLNPVTYKTTPQLKQYFS